MKNKLLPWIVVLAFGILPLVSEAQVNFTFTYPSLPAGQGQNLLSKNNPTGIARRAALEDAAAKFATAFSNYNATIEIAATGYSTNNGTLMSAGSYFVNGQPSGFGTSEVTRTKILTGTDLTGIGSPDGVLNVNFFHNWELDYNTTPTGGPGGDYDWYGVLYHEFSHLVGFASGIASDGNGQNSTDLFGTSTNGNWAAFDQFLTDKDGNSVFTGTTLNTGTYESLLVGGSSPNDGLFFDPNVGNLVGLFSPSTYAGGSSGSHLDIYDTGIPPAYQDMMMLPSVTTGLATRTYSDIELEMLRTIGYTNIGQINLIPEPKHYVLGLGGVVLLVVLVRRRIQIAQEN